MQHRIRAFGPEYMCARGLSGFTPTMSDMLAALHVTPLNEEQRAMFGWIRGHKPGKERYAAEALPAPIRALEAFKADPARAALPEGIDVFQFMRLMPDVPARWSQLARLMSWTQVFKNLQTLARHRIFEDPNEAHYVAGRLTSQDEILRSRAFPYQLLIAYRAVTPSTKAWMTDARNPEWTAPEVIKSALRRALDIAIANTPELPGLTVIGVDSSGSMSNPITGQQYSRGRDGQFRNTSSKAMVVDVAGLFAASCLKYNPETVVLPYDDHIHRVDLIPEDSVITICDKLPTSGGGTNTSLVLKEVVDKQIPADSIIILSDTESWLDSPRSSGFLLGRRGGTRTMELFNQHRARKPKAKLVCWNLQAGRTTQAVGDGVLNTAGFSEAIWDNVRKFLVGESDEISAWLEAVKAMSLDTDSLAAFVSACRR
jgi:60 kDa SS-A/Ro ribonucleoprotein